MRVLSSALAVVLFCVPPAAALAQGVPAGGSVIEGKVVDASTGLGLPDATVVVLDAGSERATTDGAGKFRIAGVPPGIVRVEIRKTGYQTTDSDDFATVAGNSAAITLSVQRSQTSTQEIGVIGRTSTRAAQSLQKTSVIYKDASATAIQNEGYHRVGDYLRTLPFVNANGGSETPTPGDDLYMDVRGLGPLETVTMIDGHPIAYGHKRGNNLGYNFDVSPTFALRDVQITFGSGGSDLVGISAIGGVIDMRTLEPTPVLHTSFTQAYGQYANLISTLTATGPLTSRLSFALAGGVQSRNGVLRHNSFFQPAAAYDQSAPHSSPDWQSGIYPDDSTVVQRGGLLKLRYAFGKPDNLSHLTVHGLSQYYWDDKTGNGDGDYLPYQTALASGQAQLAGYSGTTCPAGTFQAFNSNGAPNGTSPSGTPNGGIACQTPQQYAQFNTGFQGTGPTWQAFTVQDYGARFDSPLGKTNLSIDAYTNNYAQTYDRTFQLPYNAVPGDNPSWQNPSVGSTGVIVSDELLGRNNDIGIGYAYYNYVYRFLQNGALLPSPIVHETANLFHDTYHPEGSPFTVYFNAAQKTSTITHSTYFDPRLSVVYAATRNDVIRVAAGKTTSQPYATFVYTPLSLIASSGLTGNITCGTLNAIGSGGNPNLLPEKGTDEELSIGHRFKGDTQIQATLYNTNVNGKIYGTLVPVSGFSDAFLGDISSFIGKIQGTCPGDPRSQLGISVQSNVGHFISRGIDLAGRVRANRHLFFDYDYSVESSFIRSLPADVLANNLTIIPNGQLPTVPIHKYNVAVDYTLGNAVDFRLTDYYVGLNNPKHSPAYNYANFQVSSPIGKHSVVNFAVNNVFNQNADIRGRLGLGIPLPLNQYATNYAPYVGQNATELYGLPFRSFLLSYTYKAR